MWFTSTAGLSELIGYEISQNPRESSFCTHVRAGQVLVVPDGQPMSVLPPTHW